MKFTVLTLFPEYFSSPLSTSLLGRAKDSGVLQFEFVNIREFGLGRYKSVDDKPYGGGPGMLMSAVVLEQALAAALGGIGALDALEQDVMAFRSRGPQASHTPSRFPDAPYVIYMSPQGKRLSASWSREVAQNRKNVVLLCGHYEGVDERFIDAFVHEEVSIGDYVLTGGEPAAAVLIDAVARFVPGVVGEKSSVDSDTFESPSDMYPGGLKYPMFTRPPEWRGRKVPDILVSGHHGEVARWRVEQSLQRTQNRRPDLISGPPSKKSS